MKLLNFLFETANWPPRWYCGHWTDTLGWIHIISDLAIFGAYLAIPIILVYFCWSRKDLPFQKILILFGLFIVFCGTGHLVEAFIFWFPVYRFDGLIKVSTAIVSWATVIAMIPYIPRVLNFPKLEELSKILQSDLKETRDQLELAFESTRGGLWDWNILTNEMQVSSRFADFIGCRKEEINSFDQYISHIPSEDREHVLAALKKHLNEQIPFNINHRLMNSGKCLWFNAVGQAQRDKKGQALRMVGIITDIDSQVQSNEKLINANNLLTNEIISRKKAEEQLDLVIENLKNANSELEQFAYVASHDMQEPLRTISNFVDLFKNGNVGKFDAETNLYLEYIINATSRMQNLIFDLLEFSRVGKELSLEAVDCNKILNDVYIDLDQVIKESKVKITTTTLPVVKGNETALKRLFQNLLSNAIKFHKKNVQPEVSITVLEQETAYLFSIKDNGIGIEEKYIPKLFTIFQRLHTIDEYPGTGIGLATCNKIITLLHGKIWIESKFGEGTTVYFTIPKNN